MHLTDDDLILHYYSELDANAAAQVSDHLRTCAACHASFTTLQRVLTAVENAPSPEIADGFERTVWARLQPELGDRRGGWTSLFVFSPARLAWAAGIVLV